MDVFPPGELLQNVKGGDAPMFVDLGGGLGTDAVELRHRFPQLHGRVIIQELPNVIEAAKEKNVELSTQVNDKQKRQSCLLCCCERSANGSQKVECQMHDIFTPEPIYGSRIYFMGSVLHDWPDQEALEILRNVVPAMERGYSKLILGERVIAATGCPPILSALDLIMMTVFGSHERTQEHWKEMLRLEGLKLVAVHSIRSCLRSVLEVELA